MDLADKNNKKGFCRKKISVIIPVYNAEKYIRETLDSIIKQSYENWEIILVENGSEDKSPDIIREYEEKYTEIHMIKSPGKGPGPARNAGLEAAQGEYIVFVDSDDYIPDEDVVYQYISITESINADIVVSNYARLWDENCFRPREHRLLHYRVLYLKRFVFRAFFLLELCLMYGENYIKESFWKRIRLFLQIVPMQKISCLICSVMYVMRNMYFLRNRVMFTVEIWNRFHGNIIQIQLKAG